MNITDDGVGIIKDGNAFNNAVKQEDKCNNDFQDSSQQVGGEE